MPKRQGLNGADYTVSAHYRTQSKTGVKFWVDSHYSHKPPDFHPTKGKKFPNRQHSAPNLTPNGNKEHPIGDLFDLPTPTPTPNPNPTTEIVLALKSIRLELELIRGGLTEISSTIRFADIR